ncbi:hypothetical protein [Evansella tamaricis]|uniref:Uncharacterized protein n=1 Tax=Evansella tamaricis TaxID=2069301 RepID=A0ABS6JF71_9BACI|nr:hypothetical protein [Evansella tamaricis]MBU9712321.1 hypothetical protein [Evansella tamaricis]
MAIAVNFAAVNINSQSNNTGLFAGNNNTVGWDGHVKFTYGNGQYLGINATANNVNVVGDTDLIDAPIMDQDIKPGLNNQQA